MGRGRIDSTLVCAGALVAVIGAASSARAQGNASWTEPFPPFRIAGNLYYVGSKGLASYLVTTPQGHILINSDLEANVPMIRASVEKLGFKFSDIKILLISHAHWDHDAGSAADQGADRRAVHGHGRATCRSSSPAARPTSSTATDPASRYPPTKVDRVLHDGDEVKLGDAVLVAHLTPGHTKGCTTWTMKVQEAGKTYDVVIVGSPNVNPGYQLVNNAALSADRRRLRADVPRAEVAAVRHLPRRARRLLRSRGEVRAPRKRRATPFVDPDGYKKYVADREQAFQDELAKQKASAR